MVGRVICWRLVGVFLGFCVEEQFGLLGREGAHGVHCVHSSLIVRGLRFFGDREDWHRNRIGVIKLDHGVDCCLKGFYSSLFFVSFP